MSLHIQLTLNEGQAPPFDLCSEALTSSDPPLAQESRAKIASTQEDRVSSLQGAARFDAERIFEALDRLPPIEGPRVSRLLMLLADSDFLPKDVETALGELVRVSEGSHPFEDADEKGFVSCPATPVVSLTGASFPTGNLNLNASRAQELGMKTLADVYYHLSAIEEAPIRRMIVDDCRKIISLRLHFDFSNK